MKLVDKADEDCIFLDISGLSSFSICKEKGRLSMIQHLRTKKPVPALNFGSAFHAGVAVLGENRDDLNGAFEAFVESLKTQNAALPIDIMDSDKHSVERGLNLLRAYQAKWYNEHLETIKSGPQNKPLIELKFRVHLFDWRGVPVVLCGIIDRAAVDRMTNILYLVETKTTGLALSQYQEQVRPNHQISCYTWALREWGYDVTETIWDMIYKSNRKPDLKSGDAWLNLGIDLEKDFRRFPTSRNARDLQEFEFDIKSIAADYLTMVGRSLDRWPRTASAMSCHMMGGCMYKDICNTHLSEAVIRTNYEVKEWKPWEESEEN